MHDTAGGVVWWGFDSAGLATGRKMVPPPLDTRAIPKITNLRAGTSHYAGARCPPMAGDAGRHRHGGRAGKRIPRPSDRFEKTASGLAEARARGGRVILFTGATGAACLGNMGDHVFVLPTVDPTVAPIL